MFSSSEMVIQKLLSLPLPPRISYILLGLRVRDTWMTGFSCEPKHARS